MRGKIRIEGGRAGTAIERTTKAERYIHWFAAVTFVLLALTGLILSYGRYVLIPIMGPEGFSGTAAAGKAIHGIVGHLFIGAVIFLFFGFIRDSWIDLKVDAQWILKGGGYLGGGHASAGKFNAGQKAWFWVAILGGVVLIVTGLILDNNADQARVFMQNTHIVHSICSVVVVAFFFVHLYLATVGVEGNLEAMVSGTMDENFVKQHHDLWYEEIKDKSSKSDTSS